MENQLLTEIVVAGILVLSIWAGIHRGFVRTIYGIIKFALALLLASLLTPLIASCLPETVPMPSAIAYIVSFIIVNILLGVLDYALSLIDHVPVVRQVNKGLGAVAGLIRGLLIVWLGLFLIMMLTEAPWYAQMAGYIKNSPFLSQLYAWDPIPALLKNMGFPL